MSDSPVARQATSDRKKVRATAMAPKCSGMAKEYQASHTTPAPESSTPIANQEKGTSVCSTSRSWASWASPSPAGALEKKRAKARPMVRHCMAKASRPEDTMTATPLQTPDSFQALPGEVVAAMLTPSGLTQRSSRPAGPRPKARYSEATVIQIAIRRPTSAPAAIITGLWSMTMVQSEGLKASPVSGSTPRPGSQSNRLEWPGSRTSRAREVTAPNLSRVSATRICSSRASGKRAPKEAVSSSTRAFLSAIWPSE